MTDTEFEKLHADEDAAWEKYKDAMSSASEVRSKVVQTYLRWRTLSNAVMDERARRAGIE